MLQLGDQKISSLYVGETKIKRAYIGEDLIFTSSQFIKTPYLLCKTSGKVISGNPQKFDIGSCSRTTRITLKFKVLESMFSGNKIANAGGFFYSNISSYPNSWYIRCGLTYDSAANRNPVFDGQVRNTIKNLSTTKSKVTQAFEIVINGDTGVINTPSGDLSLYDSSYWYPSGNNAVYLWLNGANNYTCDSYFYGAKFEDTKTGEVTANRIPFLDEDGSYGVVDTLTGNIWATVTNAQQPYITYGEDVMEL